MAITEVCQCPYCSSEGTCALQVWIFIDPMFCRCIFTGFSYVVECPYFAVVAKELGGV